MTACTLYDEGLVMGTGDLVSGATTVTSWSQDSSWSRGVERKNVQIRIGSRVFSTRVLADNTTTLTIKDACPFTDAS